MSSNSNPLEIFIQILVSSDSYKYIAITYIKFVSKKFNIDMNIKLNYKYDIILSIQI